MLFYPFIDFFISPRICVLLNFMSFDFCFSEIDLLQYSKSRCI